MKVIKFLYRTSRYGKWQHAEIRSDKTLSTAALLIKCQADINPDAIAVMYSNH